MLSALLFGVGLSQSLAAISPSSTYADDSSLHERLDALSASLNKDSAKLHEMDHLLADMKRDSETMLLASKGSRMTRTEAGAAEAALAENPDLEAPRLQLLGYYSMARFSDTSTGAKREALVLWFIEHMGDTSIPGLVMFTMMIPRLDSTATCDHVRDAWLKRIAAQPSSTRLLDNAAEAFGPAEPALSYRLYGQAQQLTPQDPHWPHQVGFLHLVHAQFEKDPAAKDAESHAAIRSYESALQLAKSHGDVLQIEGELSRAAYQAHELSTAERHASALLRDAKKDDWNYGDALQRGHTILGLIALDARDTKRAIAHLASSAEVPTSPILGSSGPSMSLAKRLPSAGERKAVIDYLTACKKLWPRGEQKLSLWIEQITKGLPCEFKGAVPD